MPDSSAISVIIATYKRPIMLQRCLDSLIQANKPKGRIEIIVVDDGGGMELDTGKYAGEIDIQWLQLDENQGQSIAQSRGVEVACSEILAFLDDDAVVDKKWLRAIQSYFEKYPEISALLGKIEPIDPTHILVRMRQQIYERRHRKYTDLNWKNKICQDYDLLVPPGALICDHISGGNSALKRQTLAAIGGLATNMRRNADDFLTRRLLSASYAIGYSPDMVIYHQHNESWRITWQQAFQEGLAREYSRAFIAGGQRRKAFFSVFPNMLKVPFEILDFPEMLAADKNKLKVYLIYTLHQGLIAAGRFWQNISG